MIFRQILYKTNVFREILLREINAGRGQFSWQDANYAVKNTCLHILKDVCIV
jgi:hypothetical protein